MKIKDTTTTTITDKIGGEKFSREFEESATQLDLFLKRYETYIEGRKSLLDLLDHGTVYYHAQYHEAKIVVNVSKIKFSIVVVCLRRVTLDVYRGAGRCYEFSCIFIFLSRESGYNKLA